MGFIWISNDIKKITQDKKIIDMFPDNIETIEWEMYILFKLKLFIDYCKRTSPSSYWPWEYPIWYDSDFHISIPEFTPNGWSYRKTYIWLFILFKKLNFEVFTFFSKKSYYSDSFKPIWKDFWDKIINGSFEDKEIKNPYEWLSLEEILNMKPLELNTGSIGGNTPINEFIHNPDEYSLFYNQSWKIPEFSYYEDEIFFKNIFILTPFVDKNLIDKFDDTIIYYVNSFINNTISEKYWITLYEKQKKIFIQQFSSLYNFTWEYSFSPNDNKYLTKNIFPFYLFIFVFFHEWYIKIWLKNHEIDEEEQKLLIDNDIQEYDEFWLPKITTTANLEPKEIDSFVFYNRLDFYITATDKLKKVIHNISKIINVTIEKLFDEDYKSIKIIKKWWIPDLLEWDMVFDSNKYRYVDLEKKYAHSSITWEVHKWDTKVFKVKEKVKFQE